MTESGLSWWVKKWCVGIREKLWGQYFPIPFLQRILLHITWTGEKPRPTHRVTVNQSPGLLPQPLRSLITLRETETTSSWHSTHSSGCSFSGFWLALFPHGQ